MSKKALMSLLLIGLILVSCYGFGRLYFNLTAGFTIGNISSEFTPNPSWDVRPLTNEEQAERDHALSQSYSYFDKGRQSYVFLSQDGRYVIKFFKYQRFRLPPWLNYFPPLPAIIKYKKEKQARKWSELDLYFKSWKIAFEQLKENTGIVFVHLNKTQDLQKALVLYDKMGKSHSIHLDNMEFCIQRCADMLCPTLLKLKEEGKVKEAQELVYNLLNLFLSEYKQGLSDIDHALMQNTGVIQGQPIHIDVGRFVINEKVKDPEIYRQELFTNTYYFRIWLQSHFPELGDYLENQLQEIIGPVYQDMRPQFRVR